MDHRDHVGLIREGVLGGGKTWADLGSGEGAFTLALADLLGPTGSIYTVDRDSRALRVQTVALRDAFPNVNVTPLIADFAMPLELPPLDGIVMANSEPVNELASTVAADCAALDSSPTRRHAGRTRTFDTRARQRGLRCGS